MSGSNSQAQAAINACNAQNETIKAQIAKYNADYRGFIDASKIGQFALDALNNASYGQNYNGARPAYRDVPGYTTTKNGNHYYIYNDGGFMNRSRYDPGGVSKCKTMSLNIDPNTNGYIADACIQTMQTLTPVHSFDPNPLQRGDVEWYDVPIGGNKCDGSRDVTAYCKKTAQRIDFENKKLASVQNIIDNNRVAATTLPAVVNNNKCSICASSNVLVAGAGTSNSNINQSNSCAIPTAAELAQHQADLDRCTGSGGTYNATTFLCTAAAPLLPAPTTAPVQPNYASTVAPSPVSNQNQPTSSIQQPAVAPDKTVLYGSIAVVTLVVIVAVIIIVKKKQADE